MRIDSDPSASINEMNQLLCRSDRAKLRLNKGNGLQGFRSQRVYIMAWIRLGLAFSFLFMGTVVFGDDEKKSEEVKTPPPSSSSSTDPTEKPSTESTQPKKPAPSSKTIVGTAVGTIVKINGDKITIKQYGEIIIPGKTHTSGKKHWTSPPTAKVITKEFTYDMSEDGVRVKLVRSSGSIVSGSMSDVAKGQLVQLSFSDIKDKDADGKTDHRTLVTKIEISTEDKPKE